MADDGQRPRAADLQAIMAVKHAYLRLLDTKQFHELGRLLTDDVRSAYDSGKMSHEGRAAVVRFLEESLADTSVVTMHTAHHPEITFTSETTATGTWYLEDRVIVHAMDFELHGTALYHDEYRTQDGSWLISATGYRRIFEERRRRSNGEVLSFHTMFDAERGAGAAQSP